MTRSSRRRRPGWRGVGRPSFADGGRRTCHALHGADTAACRHAARSRGGRSVVAWTLGRTLAWIVVATGCGPTPASDPASVAWLERGRSEVRLRGDGAGAARLLEQVRQADVVVIGEMHGIAEMPGLTEWLFREGGCDRLAIEVSPFAAERLERLAGEPSFPDNLIPYADPVALPFYALREEAASIGALVADRGPGVLCGLDQEFILGAEWPLWRLAEIAPRTRELVERWVERQRDGIQSMERGDPRGLFLASVTTAELELARTSTDGSAEAGRLLDALATSAEIYRTRFAGDVATSNRLREDLLARNLTACAAARAPDPPRILIRIGALHGFRAQSPIGDPVLGAAAARLAERRGGRSFHLLVLGGAGTEVAGLRLPVPRMRRGPIAHPAWALPFVEAARENGATLFDLRALEREMPGEAPFGDVLRLAFAGYDAVLVIGDSRPSTPLTVPARTGPGNEGARPSR